MQEIAQENNLAETAFLVREEHHFHIRWFTPTVEVDLCGHATLAAAHVIFMNLGYEENLIRFDSRSGELRVRRDQGLLALDFPSDRFEKAEIPACITKGIGKRAAECYRGKTDSDASHNS